MCVLCGQDFVAQAHWTDRHVEDRARASGPRADPVEYQRDRRRDRGHRVVLTNEVLHHYGLRVEDWSGSKYVLRDRKGRSELVQDLGSLWPAAAKLAGRTPDPLDPALCEALSAAHEGWDHGG
jgi:hypothetical protein